MRGILSKILLLSLPFCSSLATAFAQAPLIIAIPDSIAGLSTPQNSRLQELRSDSLYESITCVQMGSLKDISNAGVINFELPGYQGTNGQWLTVVGDRIEYLNDSNYKFSGHSTFNGINDGEVLIVLKDGHYSGRVRPYNAVNRPPVVEGCFME